MILKPKKWGNSKLTSIDKECIIKTEVIKMLNNETRELLVKVYKNYTAIGKIL